jgi:uncharacterized protein YbaR (Trm112 family)
VAAGAVVVIGCLAHAREPRYPIEDDVPIMLIEAAELPRGRACQQGS